MKTNEKFSNRKVAYNVVFNMTSKVLNILIFILIHQILINRIPVEEYSILPVINSIIAIFYIARFAISGGISRFLGDEYYKNNIKHLQERLASYVVVIFLGVCVLFAVAGLFYMNFQILMKVSAEYEPMAKNMFILLVASFGFNVILAPFEIGLYIKQRFLIISIAEIFCSLLKIALIAVFFYIFHISAYYYVLANVIADTIVFLVRAVIAKRVLHELRFKFSNIRKKYIKEQLKFGGWLMLSRISEIIYRNIDPIILNHFSSPYQVTRFFLGSMFRKQFDKIKPAFLQPFFPMLSGYHALEKQHKFNSTVISYGKYFTWFYLLIAVPVALLRDSFIQIYTGGNFSDASIIILILLIEPMAILGTNLLLTIGQIKLEMRKVTFAVTIIQVINFILTIILVIVLELGALGSALATFFSNFIVAPFIQIPLMLSITKIKARRYLLKTVIPGFLPALLPIGAFFLLFSRVSVDSWFGFIVIAAILDVILVVACIPFLGKTERNEIKNIIVRKKN